MHANNSEFLQLITVSYFIYYNTIYQNTQTYKLLYNTEPNAK